MPKPDLEDIYEQVRADPFWSHLRMPGIRLVGGTGPADPEAMIIGEAPGAVENTRGLPFSGPSGGMLSQFLHLAGLSRGVVFITNTVKYRPPGNRTPTTKEIAHGAGCLRQEYLAIGSPGLVITLGVVARR